ncbi:ATP-binding protein [Nitrospirillum sp. BR 11752]|uniref:ATP-binding protein n=1 Tax=Nitrospirillum sp. BR 11752 TaxID=3104293 RepID=UPI002EBC80A7|nr:ATP-binding protein [Nitrospirillum sp. BR 11752]
MNDTQVKVETLMAPGNGPIFAAAPRKLLTRLPILLGPYVISFAMVLMATGVAYLADRLVAPASLATIYLSAVVFSALRYGWGPSLATSILSITAWDFLFIPPVYHFEVGSPEDLLAMALFCIVAVVVSELVSQIRSKTATIKLQADTTAALFAFYREITSVDTEEALSRTIARQVAGLLGGQAALQWSGADGLITGGEPVSGAASDTELRDLMVQWRAEQAAGLRLRPLCRPGACLVPLWASGALLGVLAVFRPATSPFLPAEFDLLHALADQAAHAAERMRLTAQVQQVQAQAETERLRNALLTSISHDLRTPLSTIMGVHSVLLDPEAGNSPAERQELLAGAQEEADRLDRFIGNLLDMTRLEAGGLRCRREAVDVADVVDAALERVAAARTGRPLTIAVAPDLPMVMADYLLMEQILFNLLDNALKHTPPGTAMTVSATSQGGQVQISIEDEGPGIPPDALEAIFDKFSRLRAGDAKRTGTGLGLAICRGFAQAMGGDISAGNRPGGGAVFRLWLPGAPS